MKERVEQEWTARHEGLTEAKPYTQALSKNVPKGVRLAPTIKRPLRATKAEADMMLLLLLLSGLLQEGEEGGGGDV